MSAREGKVPNMQDIPPPPPPSPGQVPMSDYMKSYPKSDSGATLPRETEKEKIKRQLYNLIDRVDKL